MATAVALGTSPLGLGILGNNGFTIGYDPILKTLAMKRKTRSTTTSRPPSARPQPSSGRSMMPSFNYASLAVLGGVFVLGVGIGIGFSSATNSDPGNVATREVIDRAAPNPEICVQFGASAIAMDTRIFVTFSPFSVYVSQPKMQPGCVLRRSNITILEQRKLINAEDVRDCKRRLNTFSFTGNLESNPEISCVYQSDAAKNLFLDQQGVNKPPADTENF